MASRVHTISNRHDHPMISMRNVIVNGGTFTNIRDGRKSPFDILRDAVASSAFHDSGVNFDRPKCHPNTRVAVLDKITSWALHRDKETWDRYIMWVTGPAGAGKSAILQTFVESSLVSGLVIASFFFWRSDVTRNHARALIATLAYQIYQAVPGTQQQILSVIEADPFVLTKGLEHQFVELVVKPLHTLNCSGISAPLEFWRVMVIDGLDECLDKKAQREIIRMISYAIEKFELPILFLIASRPEHEINVQFRSDKMACIFTRLYLDDAYNSADDIRRFFQDKFEEIRTNHPFRKLLPAKWPTPQGVDTLVEKSSGQFIYASTVVQYVQSISHQPHHRLDAVLNLRPPQGDLPFAQLDALYKMILSSAANINQVLYAISIYSLRVASMPPGHSHSSEEVSPSSLDICAFMSITEEEVNVLFCDLEALVSVRTTLFNRPISTVRSKTSLKIHHASLHDFLLDHMRSGEYCINTNACRTEHLINILNYLKLPIGSTDDRMIYLDKFSRTNFLRSRHSEKLMQQVSLFPFVELLCQDQGIGGKRRFMSRFILFVFLPFCQRMARLHGEWLSIQKHQDEVLDMFFLSRMPFYYSRKEYIAHLCLACHAGSNYLVPGLAGTECRDITILHRDAIHGPLLLDDILVDYRGTDVDHYRQCVIRFLNDTNRSGRFVVGDEAYAVSASYFIDLLQNLTGGGCSKVDENNLLSHLIHWQDKDAWVFLRPKGCRGKHRGFKEHNSTSTHYFIYLGYVIFFLSRSTKSEQLMEYCRKQSFLTELWISRFPSRTKLARQAMDNYVQRVTGRVPRRV